MPTLSVEHIAWNVSDPAAMARWYVENLGMRILRQSATAPHVHFISDAGARTVIELYNNTDDPIPDYASQHPLRFHLAFDAPDPDAARDALVSAGATFVSDQTMPEGSRLVMLRDPWGVPLQLCKRPQPLRPAQ